MKLFTFFGMIVILLSQLATAQNKVQPTNNNAMSGLIGLTLEGGVTLGLTDYKTNTMNYNGKFSVEYYFPSTGQGNLGVRAFGQKGKITGKDAPVGSGNLTNEFATDFDILGGGLIYTLSIGDAVYPWVSIGASNVWFSPQDINSVVLPNGVAGKYTKSMLAYNGDAGVKIFVSKGISFNLMGGIIIGTEDWMDDINGGSGNDLLITANAGVSYYFGRETDTDGDGVSNADDACPGTQAGVKVDEFGCPLDADKDGVPDYLDKCANTPKEAKVDKNGCPLDSDGDLVPDYLDKCQNTPSAAKVDANGCPLDTDGDGVPDYLDKCTSTPKGAKVDANGCPMDSDGDGVADYLDKCPNTPAKVEVDKDGCPIEKEVEIVVIEQEVKTVVLSGDANFEFGKANLLQSAHADLNALATTMVANPSYKWEVAGHTDGVGSASYNKELSRQRAQSVVTYLVSKGVNTSNLKIVGYGKDSPIASNDTVEGRAMNRRVEVKLLSKN